MRKKQKPVDKERILNEIHFLEEVYDSQKRHFANEQWKLQLRIGQLYAIIDPTRTPWEE